MKTRLFSKLLLAAVFLQITLLAPTLRAQTTAFTYQGFLLDNGAPANGSNDLRFVVFDAASAGSAVSSTITIDDLLVTNGLFTVALDFGSVPFDGSDRWLEVRVRPGAASGPFTDLAPRYKLSATPYAMRALTAGTATIANSVAVNSVGGAGLQNNSVTSANIVNGSIDTVDLNNTVLNQSFWKLGGNTGTSPGSQFIGTTDDQPLEFKVNGLRVLRIEHIGDSSDSGTIPDGAPNMIGGAPNNFVAAGVVGAVIAGGGATNSIDVPVTVPNSVSASFGVIGGGFKNTIGASGTGSTIAGGIGNTIQTGAPNGSSTIGGGVSNLVGSQVVFGTIGGGWANSILTNSHYATISGGFNSFIGAGAYAATIPGGFQNEVHGNYSLAAGYNAKALHNGTFVWADGSGGDFASSGLNQFLVRAAGGVGINKTNPTSTLDVNGNVTALGFSGSGANLTNLNATRLATGTIDNARLSADVALTTSDVIFNGTITAGDTLIGPALNVGNFNVITGYRSSVTAGERCTNNADRSTIAGGYANVTLGNSTGVFIGGGGTNLIGTNASFACIPGGTGAKADKLGQQSLATGFFATAGDAQSSTFVVRQDTSGAVSTVLLLDGNTSTRRLSIPTNTTWAFDAQVTGRSSTGVSAAYQIRGCIKNTGGTTGFVGVPTVTVLGEDNAALDSTAIANNTDDSLDIQVTGLGGTLIRWVATVRVTEVGY